MTNLWAVFLTGLTTGGLSCLAVQGGLLASSIARQAEEDMQEELADKAGKSRGAAYEEELKMLQAKSLPKKQHVKALQKLKSKYPLSNAVEDDVRPKWHAAQPIVLFLVAKLVAYTLLGFLLGWLGSVLQLSPVMRGVLQFAIGVFMLGTALRMLKVHPFFDRFVIEPPKFITRYIRKRAKQSEGDMATPLFLGALTVFIPCGVTQAIMALAVGTGNPGLGAATMFAFTLGTTPVFFGLAYLATKLGETLQAKFLKVAAVAVLVLGLVSLEGGLNLTGSPISFAAFKDSLGTKSTKPPQATVPVASENENTPSGPMSTETNVLTIRVEDYSYEPNYLEATAGQPVKLALVTKDSYGCGRAFTVPALDIQEILPETGTTYIDIPAQKKGVLRFSCSMGMYRGQIKFN